MDPGNLLTAWAVIAFASAIIGLFVGITNDRMLEGAALGALLGPFGVVATVALRPSQRLCNSDRIDLAQAIAQELTKSLPSLTVDRSGPTATRGSEPRSAPGESRGRTERSDPDAYRTSTDLAMERPGPVQSRASEARSAAPASHARTDKPPSAPYRGLVPGFYADPLDPSRQRYWNGNDWLTRTYPGGERVRAAPTVGPMTEDGFQRTLGTMPPKIPYVGLAEGFYIDPLDDSRERFWSGEEWDIGTYPRRVDTPPALGD